MDVIGIIPARYGSTRFPGKPLVDIRGKSMIQRVAEQAAKSNLKAVFVATDDERIYNHVTQLGVSAVMTSSDHQSGTDRCLEAYLKCGLTAEAVINIQGDEPFVDPQQIHDLCALVLKNEVDIATLAKRIHDAPTLLDSNKVKLVKTKQGKALYFSRQPIPFRKGAEPEQWHTLGEYYKHLGLYAYKVDVLRQICGLPLGMLEQSESLEQLRWLENGWNIYVAETALETPAIDTPSDLERLLASEGHSF